MSPLRNHVQNEDVVRQALQQGINALTLVPPFEWRAPTWNPGVWFLGAVLSERSRVDFPATCRVGSFDCGGRLSHPARSREGA